jgi:hypothetical protein
MKKNKSLIDSVESLNLDNNIDKITSGINSKLEIIEKTKTPYQVNDKIFNDILMNQTDGINFSQIIFFLTILAK